jgi:hypothetical protein
MEKKMKEFDELLKITNRNTEQNNRLAALDLDLATITPLSSEMFLRYKQARKQIEVKA